MLYTLNAPPVREKKKSADGRCGSDDTLGSMCRSTNDDGGGGGGVVHASFT